ncbi:MAG: dTDP-4-dehydrorhamnose 3,5-epimerase [Gammaproteobacteria bacterium]|nr:dTDP-4-dehydrorhamnose 3,5-epimerase [Gammaproteobacteria bacterium]
MIVKEAPLQGVKVFEPKVFGDERGYFLEAFQSQRYKNAGIDLDFVQDNISRSSKGVLRGLHYQLRHPQGKLVTVVRGRVFDVAADIRKESPTFGQWFGLILDDQNHKQLYIPPGFAHGFVVLSDHVDFCYKCTDYYTPDDEYGVAWNDKTIAIDWHILEHNLVLSDKDRQYQQLADISSELLPKYSG